MLHEVPPDKHVGCDEPWRFRCPDCGQTEWSIQTRGTASRERLKGMRQPDSPLYCKSCSTPLDGLYDAKQDAVIEYGALDVPKRLQRPTTTDIG
jgi:predicted RNA-binding Zn-ribbon protein involved in translation (DUF1610 family)